MLRFLALLSGLALVLACAAPRASGAVSESGWQREGLGRGVQLYVPPGAGDAPLPLLVVLQGTGGKARAIADTLVPMADAGGFAMLAVDPARDNFDAVETFFDDYERRAPSAMADWPVPRLGRDRARLLAAVKLLQASGRVDGARVGLLGFSHGGSYALAVGLAHPEMFASVAALSPGLLLVGGAEAAEGQAVFLAHGSNDPVQPFARTMCAMPPKLEALGRRVTLFPHDEGHALSGPALGAAVAHFLSGGEVLAGAGEVGCGVLAT